MGYSTRPSMISENVELLTKIKAAVDSNEEFKMKVKDHASITTEQYRLRRLLAATDHYPTEFGGAFSRLGARTALKIDATRGLIIASRRGGAAVEEYRANENDALEFIASAKGSLITVEFYPSSSFSLERFGLQTKALGWDLIPATAEAEPDGKLSVALERAEPSATTDWGKLLGD